MFRANGFLRSHFWVMREGSLVEGLAGTTWTRGAQIEIRLVGFDSFLVRDLEVCLFFFVGRCC